MLERLGRTAAQVLVVLDNAFAWLDFHRSQRHNSARWSAIFSRQVRRRWRSWQEHGKTRTAELSDREWWFQRFSLLRNGPTHGSSIGDAASMHEGLAHTHIAQEALVEAVAAAATAAETEATAGAS